MPRISCRRHISRRFAPPTASSPDTNLRAWLFTILHNTARNRARDRAREHVTVDSEAVDRAADTRPPAAAETPESLLLRDDARAGAAGGHRRAARRVPPGGLVTRRGRVFVCRNRRDARDSGRHGHVAHLARPPDAVRSAEGDRRTCRQHQACLTARPSTRSSRRTSTASCRPPTRGRRSARCASVRRAGRAIDARACRPRPGAHAADASCRSPRAAQHCARAAQRLAAPAARRAAPPSRVVPRAHAPRAARPRRHARPDRRRRVPLSDDRTSRRA